MKSCQKVAEQLVRSCKTRPKRAQMGEVSCVPAQKFPALRPVEPILLSAQWSHAMLK